MRATFGARANRRLSLAAGLCLFALSCGSESTKELPSTDAGSMLDARDAGVDDSGWTEPLGPCDPGLVGDATLNETLIVLVRTVEGEVVDQADVVISSNGVTWFQRVDENGCARLDAPGLGTSAVRIDVSAVGFTPAARISDPSAVQRFSLVPPEPDSIEAPAVDVITGRVENLVEMAAELPEGTLFLGVVCPILRSPWDLWNIHRRCGDVSARPTQPERNNDLFELMVPRDTYEGVTVFGGQARQTSRRWDWFGLALGVAGPNAQLEIGVRFTDNVSIRPSVTSALGAAFLPFIDLEGVGIISLPHPTMGLLPEFSGAFSRATFGVLARRNLGADVRRVVRAGTSTSVHVDERWHRSLEPGVESGNLTFLPQTGAFDVCELTVFTLDGWRIATLVDFARGPDREMEMDLRREVRLPQPASGAVELPERARIEWVCTEHQGWRPGEPLEDTMIQRSRGEATVGPD